MMKLTMKKTLVAASIAIMAMSGAAEARIQDASTGSSEFVFSAWDGVLGYTYDLNWTSTLNSVIGADTAYTTAPNGTVAGVTAGSIIFDQVLTGLSSFANLSNVQWNLAAADNSGRNRLLISQGDSAASMMTSNSKIKSAVTGFNSYVGAVNGKGTHVGADVNVDGYANTVPTDLAAYAGASGWASTINGNIPDSSSLLGASTNLWVLGMNSSTTTGTAGSSAGWLTQLTGTDGSSIIAKTYLSSVDNQYHLQIAAVPEADTYAMFLAGLGLMGFIARRRMQA